jgi:putative transposase
MKWGVLRCPSGCYRVAGWLPSHQQLRSLGPGPENAWEEFIPFLDYDVEIRQVICSRNAIESLNARYRRAVKARGHFPTEQAALKCLYLVTRSLDPTGRGQARWAMRWKPAINAFAITFGDRFPAAETY